MNKSSPEIERFIDKVVGDSIVRAADREKTVMPELVRLFKKIEGKSWHEMLRGFLVCFSQCKFTVPAPDDLQKLFRDESIIRTLLQDDSDQSRIDILLKHRSGGVDYAHIKSLWRTCTEKELPPPACAGNRVTAAKKAAKRHPSIAEDICAMHELSADDEEAVLAAASKY